MKQFLTTIIFTLTLIVGGFQMVNAQCDGTTFSINEDDFMPGNICADQTNTNPAPVSTNMIDIYDATTGAAGMDGVMDMQLCYQAVVSNPNAGGGCENQNYFIGAGWGGSGSNCDGTGSSDFGGTFDDNCVCINGYIVMTVKFLNGFGTTAAGFDFDWSSINGGSEGYEYGFGFVSAGTDANGTALAGLNTQGMVLPLLNTYCNAEYAAMTTISQHALGSMMGVFTMQGDDLNAAFSTENGMDLDGNPGVDYMNGMNVCDGFTADQGGEDTPGSPGHSGPNSAGDAAGVSGLNPTDIITEVTFIYGLSNANGTDCDGDGDTGVGGNPSGSFSGIDICVPPLPCGFPTEPTVTLEESCGTFNIVVGPIDESDASGTGTMVTYGTSAAGPFTAMVTGMEGLAADGTPYYIQICDAADLTCCSVFGPYSIMGSSPNAPTFVPCTTGTTGIGGN